MNDPKMRTDQQARSDLQDRRGGANDPIDKVSKDDALPEGLKRPRKGPLSISKKSKKRF